MDDIIIMYGWYHYYVITTYLRCIYDIHPDYIAKFGVSTCCTYILYYVIGKYMMRDMSI